MQELEKVILEGGVAVIPTDTLYGVVAKALDQEAVLKIYDLKKRSPEKPFLILISSIDDLSFFGSKPDQKTLEFLKKFWPGKVSVILSCTGAKFEYLHRGTQTLAFRIPNKSDLVELLQKTGPLVAPSANPENEKPAETIEDAKKYFGNNVDLYADEGKLSGEPSTLISIENGEVKVLRRGAVKF